MSLEWRVIAAAQGASTAPIHTESSTETHKCSTNTTLTLHCRVRCSKGHNGRALERGHLPEVSPSSRVASHCLTVSCDR